jgi:glycosyltransferase involved in cell wall biosynthesis
MANFNQRLTGGVQLAISPSQHTLDLHRERGFFLGAEQLALVNGIAAGAKPAPRPPKETFDVLFLGRVQTYKGPQVLIRAFRGLSNPALRLHIAGTGPDLEACRSLAEGDPRIRFHGFIGGDDLRDLMALADCAVLPSLWPENAPVSIQESFQAGPVMIASRIGGIPEMVRDGLNGLLVDPGDERAIARSIEKLQQSPELVSRLRAEAFRTARLYDMAFHTGNLTQAYRRLIATNRVSPLTRKAA